jgi:glycosyltransferase involved in cell wall biosynthesis
MGKIKVLMISDDIRDYTGVGIQSNKLLTGLAKNKDFEVIQMGVSPIIFASNPNPVNVDGVKVFPTRSYADMNLFRYLLSNERPDVVIPFSDPRFFIPLFSMDDDIRKKAWLVFYHLWDNYPFPRFNTPWYKACDELVLISKFAYDMYAENGWNCHFIPHGYDDKEFYRTPEANYITTKNDILKQLNRDDIDFIIFWNNKNLHRKRGADIITTFHSFYKEHPKSVLIMHTEPTFPDGFDLISINDDLTTIKEIPVIFSIHKDKSLMLNNLYNMSDVSINFSYNEGFGLSVGESLLAETPVIATATGGMIEQLTTKQGVAGKLLDPLIKTLFGVPGNSYVYQDFASNNALLLALNESYENRQLWRDKGRIGREHIQENYHINGTIDKWASFLKNLVGKERTYKPWQLFSIPSSLKEVDFHVKA